MKKFCFLFITLSLFLIGSASAQNTEYSIHLNSGLFSFGGNSAAQYSRIIVSDIATIDNYTNNPYGKRKGLSYGLAAQIQRITKRDLILGLQSGYEVLRSRVEIDGISGEFIEPPAVSSGETILTHGFFTLYPHIGKRFHVDELKIDLALGPEFGFNLLSKENGEVETGNDLTIETNTERSDPGTDVRIHPSLTLYYKNLGVSAGYSYGLHNYSGDLAGANGERFSRFIRLGISYNIH